MKKEYNISELNPKKNPYIGKLKKQVTINLDNNTIEYFKTQSKETGLPYQTLINLYLSDCATNERKLNLSWQ
ncbi:BrnA antitoxin family protein [Candidatus Saccharibacteria bacterium]|nr:BrnA antitoxin family protein [Candidatus Saccharibacteria bacterium]